MSIEFSKWMSMCHYPQLEICGIYVEIAIIVLMSKICYLNYDVDVNVLICMTLNMSILLLCEKCITWFLNDYLKHFYNQNQGYIV